MNQENFKIETYLKQNEIILYQGKPVVGKVSKLHIPSILVLIFIAFIQLISILDSMNLDGSISLDSDLIILLLISLLIASYFIYEVIYRIFFRDKKIIYYEYYLTNERVIRYDKSKNKVISNYVNNYDTVFIEQNKEGYGDITFRFMSSDDDDKPGITISKSNYVNRGRPIVFESIENPDMVLDIVKQNFPKFK